MKSGGLVWGAKEPVEGSESGGSRIIAFRMKHTIFQKVPSPRSTGRNFLKHQNRNQPDRHIESTQYLSAGKIPVARVDARV